MNQLDILVVSLPVLDLQYPPSSPAVIKSCAIAAGFTAKTYDLNLLLLQICGGKDQFYRIQYNFENASSQSVTTDDPVLAFFTNDHDIIRQWVDQSIEIIQQYNPKWLGISVFSYKSHKACLLLCAELKRRKIDIKIVLGGRGASSYALGPDHSQFIGAIKNFFGKYPHKNFSETLLHYNLTDKVIQGDGENAIVELLSTNTDNNINARVDDINLEKIPFVDFDDYDLVAYNYVNEPILPITGSKGCVRQCTFCDIPVLWPKFKFRTGTHIAEEMIHLYKQHKVKKFYMTDSLVNGSLKAFTDFITILAEHNAHSPGKEIKWVGQYITRTRSAVLSDQYYKLLKASGGEGLTIGVESGSDNVRAHMKKQFKTVDIDHEIEQFDRYGIVCVLLFFSCYPTETWQDFVDTVQMFIRYQRYCASGTVYKITLGTPYTHHAQTPLWNMQDQIGLESKSGSDILWRLSSNPELTYYERVRRRLILQEVATALSLPMSRNTAELNQMIYSIQYHNKSIVKYFKKQQTPITFYKDQYKLTAHESILMPTDIQHMVYTHLQNNLDLPLRIQEKHSEINDDIQFDNSAYVTLRELITKEN